MPRLLDNDDSPGGKFGFDSWQHSCQAANHIRGAKVLEAQEHDFAGRIPQCGGDLPEIEIRRNYHAILRQGFLEDLAVGHSMQAFFAQMNCIVSLGPELICHADVYAHIH